MSDIGQRIYFRVPFEKWYPGVPIPPNPVKLYATVTRFCGDKIEILCNERLSIIDYEDVINFVRSGNADTSQ